MNPQTTTLFSPIRIGAIEAANRIFMAPLTRCRSTPGTDAPNAMIAEYYGQRASAGIIVSEPTQVLATGKGYVGTPGIYSPEQEAGWKLATVAVHAKGGKIIAQLWHVGAISHPDLQPGHVLPVSASTGCNPGGTIYTQNGKVDRIAERRLETAEVKAFVEAYRHSAEVAKPAGFDGVEIHFANGYLLEQFIRDSSNKRIDEYGGAIENRIRFTLEVIDAAISVWGKERVGIRLSPVTAANNARQQHSGELRRSGRGASYSRHRVRAFHRRQHRGCARSQAFLFRVGEEDVLQRRPRGLHRLPDAHVATIHGHHCARDVARRIRAQKHDRIGDLGRVSPARHRDAAHDLRVALWVFAGTA